MSKIICLASVSRQKKDYFCVIGYWYLVTYLYLWEHMFNHSSERENLAHKISQSYCASYKNTSRRDLTQRSIRTKNIVWTIICLTVRKIWNKIICLSFIIHANVLHSWNVKQNNHVQKEKSRRSATFAVTYFDESRYVKFH